MCIVPQTFTELEVVFNNINHVAFPGRYNSNVFTFHYTYQLRPADFVEKETKLLSMNVQGSLDSRPGGQSLTRDGWNVYNILDEF